MNGATIVSRYEEALANLPPSGGGGCHCSLLSVANLARAAGVSPERALEDLAAAVHGTRRVPRSEIASAVRKAYDGSTFTPRPRARARARARVDSRRLLDAIRERGQGFTLADIWHASPIHPAWPVERDAPELLKSLYDPHEPLFIGPRHAAGAEHVRPASEWIRLFENGSPVPEQIVVNPLSGKVGLTKDGKQSYRADACVTAFRFTLLEFDGIPLDEQIRFWAGVKLPLAALIHSGGKSIHGWVRVDATDRNEWECEVEQKLFDILGALGVDPSCKNESRLSRMPGCFRSEKHQWQRLLFLAPTGRAVQP